MAMMTLLMELALTDLATVNLRPTRSFISLHISYAYPSTHPAMHLYLESFHYLSTQLVLHIRPHNQSCIYQSCTSAYNL
jgi:hypothetical protein